MFKKAQYHDAVYDTCYFILLWKIPHKWPKKARYHDAVYDICHIVLFRKEHIILHCLASSCIVLHHLALSCIILHHLASSCLCLASSCIALHRLALSCIILHHLASSCIILHTPNYNQNLHARASAGGNKTFIRALRSSATVSHLLWGRISTPPTAARSRSSSLDISDKARRSHSTPCETAST